MKPILTGTLLGLVFGAACISMPEGDNESSLAPGSWVYCALERTSLGFYGRKIQFDKKGELKLSAGYYEDENCRRPGPFMVATSYAYEAGELGPEGLIPMKLRSSTGEFHTHLRKINGYLYLPQNILLPTTENPPDLNAPFSPIVLSH